MACSCFCNTNCKCNDYWCIVCGDYSGQVCYSHCICNLNYAYGNGTYHTWYGYSFNSYSTRHVERGSGGSGCWCNANWSGSGWGGKYYNSVAGQAYGSSTWAWYCACNGNIDRPTGATGGTLYAARTKTSFGTASTSTKITAAQITNLQTALTKEKSVRSKTAVTWTTATTSKAIDDAIANQIREAINDCATSYGGGAADIGAVSTSTKVNASWYNAAASAVNTLQAQCICNCNYCTCNCYNCTCNGNTTCSCNKVCSCNCNYCTCHCNYCTCQCNYCTCQCHYCTCDCNYCTCNCNQATYSG